MSVPDAGPLQHAFIFPLNTVLFPGGLLPLKIFEQRYMEMTKVCMRESRPFGVCLIKEGHEVGTPAVPQEVGCLAQIVQWDMPQLGVFQLLTQGTERFRILSSTVQKNGLIEADIETLPAEPEIPPQDNFCAEVLKAIIDKVGAEHFPAPHRLDDAAWVGYRLSEVLPLALDTKQELLQFLDPHLRLTRLSGLLSSQTDEKH
jgi:Lon protease-like protein